MGVGEVIAAILSCIVISFVALLACVKNYIETKTKTNAVEADVECELMPQTTIEKMEHEVLADRSPEEWNHSDDCIDCMTEEERWQMMRLGLPF